jgi:Holliday junction resolvase RusA-like endonuclease
VREVSFVVDGIPAPKGSKNPFGGEANPRTKPWQAAVTAEAARAMNGRELLSGPLRLRVTFWFPRPQGHYGTGKNAGTLRPSAMHFHASKPDLDKLLRAIGDALSGTVFRDDAQIVIVRAKKVYTSTGAKALVTVDDANLSADAGAG